MDKNGIIEALRTLKDATQITFWYDSAQVTNRFDNQEKTLREDDSDDRIAFSLYSLIANAVFLKAKGKEASKAGEDVLRNYFNGIVGRSSEEFRSRLNQELGNALRALDAFLFDLDPIRLPELLARFAPLIVCSVASSDEKTEKDVMRSFDHNKEIVFNSAALFLRSLFHSFLNDPRVDPFQVTLDLENPVNGMFLYKGSLYIATAKSAFTLKGFREIAQNQLPALSKNLSLDTVNSVTVLYLVKELLATFSF